MSDLLSQIIGIAYAQELIPCPDGSMADPDMGCVKIPDAILDSQSNIAEVILQITNGLFTFIIGLAIASLIYGGIRYTLALGSKNEIGKAKNIIFWSIFGLIVALIAKYVVVIVLNIVS